MLIEKRNPRRGYVDDQQSVKETERLARNLGGEPGVTVWMLNEDNASKGSCNGSNLSMLLHADQGH